MQTQESKIKSNLGKKIYPVRILGYFMAIAAVLLTQWEIKGEISIHSMAFCFSLFVYPHLALLHYLKRGGTKNIEVLNLSFDMVLIGGIAHFLFYSPALFLPFFFTNSATNFSVAGKNLFLRGLLVFIVASAAIGFLTGFELIINPNLELLIPSYLYLFVGTHYTGFLSYTFGTALRKNKKQMEAQNFQLIEKSNELLVLNEEINQQNEEIVAQRDNIEKQNAELSDKNQKIHQSINYAKRIQKSILPTTEDIQKIFPESFVFFKPRDVVSGDFYWFNPISENECILVVGDCTGHGVPGAFMSLISYSLLNETILHQKEFAPDVILKKIQTRLPEILHQNETNHKDGLEAAICRFKFENDKVLLTYAGAGIPLLHIQNNNATLLKAKKNYLGGHKNKVIEQFEVFELEIQSGEAIYLFSDGFQDQFGGKDKKKYSRKKLQNLLFENSLKSCFDQKEMLQNTLKIWCEQGNERQIDDIMVIGIRF
jgi:serine phosphatase RsbU (regulator of sigma subunit)